MATVEEQAAARVAALEEKLKAEKAKLAKLAARKRALEAGQNRKAVEKRKYLIGACFVDLMLKKPDLKPGIMAELDRFLTRDTDRALFGMGPKAPKQPQE